MRTLLESVVGNGQADSFPTVIIPSEPPIVVSKSELVEAIRLVQKSLASLGIGYGSTVALSIPNSYEFAVLFFAISSQRAVAAPLNPAFRQSEFEFFLNDLKPAFILVLRDTATNNKAVVEASEKVGVPLVELSLSGTNVVLEPRGNPPAKPVTVQTARVDDVALVLHTSGTTGKPKSVPLTHTNITRTMANIRSSYHLSARDRGLLVMPLFHIHGLVAGLLAPFSSGGSVVIPPRFSASSFWKDFVFHQATWYTAVPTIHQIILSNPLPNPLPNIRFIRSCSSPLSPAVFHKLEKSLKAPVLEAYAMTEAAHQIASNPLPPRKRIPGSVGVPHGVEVRVLPPLYDGDDPNTVDETPLPPNVEGEICIRGPNVTSGYVDNPTANSRSFTPKERFFRTGDNGKMDENGYLFLTGRIKEMINRGGEKISPVEIDNVATQHPDVTEATAFAVPDELYGQTVGIAVVRRPNSTLSAADFADWLRPRLALFKVPDRIYFTAVMPKTATGKIQRRMVATAMLSKTKEESVKDGDQLESSHKRPSSAKL